MKKIVIMIFTFFCFANCVFASDVSSFEELKTAVLNGENQIDIKDNITYDSLITIDSNITINGNNFKFERSSSYTGRLFTVSAGGNLELNNLTIDGGASEWTMDLENRYYTQAENKGYIRVPTINGTNDITATSALIGNAGTLSVNNVTFQNARSTASGSVISSSGTTNINSSTFNHNCSEKNGGTLYVSGGTTNISNTKFTYGVAGCGVTTSINGAAIYTANANLNISNNTIFENNISQGNGGALFTSKTNVHIKNTTFRANKVGNDGSAINLESNGVAKSLLIEDCLFEKNHGMATTGQSMGTIWLTSWTSTEENPVVMKNLVFKENIARVGGAVADLASNTYAYFENIEAYNNEVNSGGAFYCQSAHSTINGLYAHDNNVTSYGAGIYLSGDTTIKVDNSNITNNTSVGSGTAIYLNAGEMIVSNSSLTNNTSSNRGAGMFIRGYYEGYNPVVTINNTVIKDNVAGVAGGGICVSDEETVISKVTIDNQSKLYDNVGTNYADDFLYMRANNSENNTSQTVTLDNISLAGIIGIDGWYYDNENDRFASTDNPTKFENYVGYNGYGVSLKAAGVSTAQYDLNGGTSDDIVDSITVRYGVEYTIDPNVPEKENSVFTGWNTEPDGSGVTLQPGDTYDGKSGLILYAQYQEDKNNNGIDDSTEPHYTVEFLPGENGTLEGTTKYENILSGLTFAQAGIVIPTIKPNNGYAISKTNAGWNVKPEGTINSNLTYIAQYRIEVPETGDAISKYVKLFLMSLVGFICMIIEFKRTYNN